jgi:hypothetical protein
MTDGAEISASEMVSKAEVKKLRDRIKQLGCNLRPYRDGTRYHLVGNDGLTVGHAMRLDAATDIALVQHSVDLRAALDPQKLFSLARNCAFLV